MDISTQKYIRKPLIVEAIQVTAENFESVAGWCHGAIVENGNGEAATSVNPGSQHIHLRVHNPKTPRQTKAYVGDWILYTDKGYKVYTPKAFNASFSAVEKAPGVVQAVSSPVAS